MADVRIIAALSGALLGLLLTGCGFEPRGDLDLPGTVRVHGGSFELRSALETRLAGSGVRVAGSDADLTLALSTEGFSERLLSIDPARGEAREYQVAFHVGYSMRDGDGRMVLPPGEVSVLREYRVLRRERLSRLRHQAVVHGEMRRAAAAAIMRRLHAASGG